MNLQDLFEEMAHQTELQMMQTELLLEMVAVMAQGSAPLSLYAQRLETIKTQIIHSRRDVRVRMLR